MSSKAGSYEGVSDLADREPENGEAIHCSFQAVKFPRADGHGDMPLHTMGGMLLALDWRVGNTHHIWGSAVMVAPGVALTARHVFDEMRAKGFLGDVGGYLIAFGVEDQKLVIWNADSYSPADIGDVAILTLKRATKEPRGTQDNATHVRMPVMVARLPAIGETLWLVGYRAAEHSFEGLDSASPGALSLVGSAGVVTDVYPEGRDRIMLSTSCAGVSARTLLGMSGGAAFDADGFLIGIISSGYDDADCSFVSLVWPCLFAPVAPSWPPKVHATETTLFDMASRGLSCLMNAQALRLEVDGEGNRRVGLIGPIYPQ